MPFINCIHSSNYILKCLKEEKTVDRTVFVWHFFQSTQINLNEWHAERVSQRKLDIDEPYLFNDPMKKKTDTNHNRMKNEIL